MQRVQVVFIEEQTLDAPARFLGTFAAWVKVGPGRVGERVDDLDLDAAVAWGRRQEAEQIAAAACEPPEGFETRWSARPADLDDA